MHYKKQNINIAAVTFGVGVLILALCFAPAKADFCDSCSDDSAIYDGSFDYSPSPDSSTNDPNEYDTYQYDTYEYNTPYDTPYDTPFDQYDYGENYLTPYNTPYDTPYDPNDYEQAGTNYETPDYSNPDNYYYGTEGIGNETPDLNTGFQTDATSNTFGDYTVPSYLQGPLSMNPNQNQGPVTVNINDYIDPLSLALGYNMSPITFNVSNGVTGVSYGGYGANLGYKDTGETAGGTTGSGNSAGNSSAYYDYLINGVPKVSFPSSPAPQPDPIILPTYKGADIRTQDIKPSLANIYLTSAKALGIGMIAIVSAGQPSTGKYSESCEQNAAGTIERCGAHQHDNGNAGDIILYKDGRALSQNNLDDRKIIAQFITLSVAQGADGVGAGPGYMNAITIHVGYGNPAGYWGGGVVDPHAAPQWVIDAYDKGTEMRTAQNKEVQQALKDAGYYKGAIDGNIGPQSEAAITAFQKANGLPPDGTVSPGTLAALDVLPPGGQPIQVASNHIPTPSIVYPTPGVIPTPNLSPCDTGAAGCPTRTQPSLVVDETKTTALLSTNTGTVPLPRLRPGDYVISDQGGAVPIANQTTSGVPLPNVRPGSTVPLPNLSPCDTGASGCPTLQPGDVFQVTDQGQVVPLPHLRPGDIVPLPNLRPGDVVETTPPQTSGGSSGYFNLIIPLLFTNISIPIPIPKTATNVAQNPEGQTTIGGVPVPNLRPGEEAPGYVRSDNLVVISTYEDVQRVLAAQGYYKGAIDGIKGSQTTDAIEEFQRAHGLTVDGIVGVQTLATLETVATSNNIPVGSTGGGTPPTAAGESTTIPRGPYGAEVLARAILTGDPGRIAAAQKQVEDNANAEIQDSCGGRILCLLSLKRNEDNLKAQATAQVQIYLTETLPQEAPGAVRQFKEKVQNDPSLIADLTPDQRQLLNKAFSNLPPVSGSTQTQSSGTQASGSGFNTSTNVPLQNLKPGEIGSTITMAYYGEDEELPPSNSTSGNNLGNSIPNYSYYFSPNTLLGTSNTAPTYAPPTIPLYFSLDQEAQLSDAYVYQQPSSQESYFSGFPAPSSASSQSSSGSPVFLDTDHVLELYRNSGSSDLSNVWRTSVVITKDPTTGEYRIASIIPNPNDATQTPMSLDVSNILPLYYFVTQPGSSIVSQNWNLLNSRFSRLFWHRNSDTNGSNNTSGSDYTDTSFNVGTSDATPPLLLLCPGDTLPSATQDCSFNFATSLVRKDFKDKMYWNVTDLDPGDVCTITSSPSTPEIPHAGVRFGAGRGWSNLSGFGVTISQKTIVTLTCTTPKGTHSSVTKTLNLIPEVKEI